MINSYTDLITVSSPIEEICTRDFSLIPDNEKQELRSRLYHQLERSNKEAWTKFSLFITTFVIFYILSKGHAEEFNWLGLKFKDFEFVLQYYPLYILFSYYQFTYNYVWSGLLMRQLEVLNKLLMPEIEDKKHYYFTFPASPTLLKNWCAFNINYGLKTAHISMSFLTAIARMIVTIVAMYYVITYNIEKYGWLDWVNIIIYIFAIVTFVKWSEMIVIFNKTCRSEISMKAEEKDA